MENINKFESGVVSWKTFENLHDSTSILFDRIKHIVSTAIEMSDWKTTDPMPFDIIDDLVKHQELRLKDSWKCGNAEKRTKAGQDLAALNEAYDSILGELGKANEEIGGLEYQLEKCEGKERTDLKVVDGD